MFQRRSVTVVTLLVAVDLAVVVAVVTFLLTMVDGDARVDRRRR